MIWTKIVIPDPSLDWIWVFQNVSLLPSSQVLISITTDSAADPPNAFVLVGRQYLINKIPAGTNVFYAVDAGGKYVGRGTTAIKAVNYDIPTVHKNIILSDTVPTTILAPEGSYIALQNLSESDIRYSLDGSGNFSITEYQMTTFSFTRDTTVTVKGSKGNEILSYLIAQSPNVTMLSDENRQLLEDIINEMRLMQEIMATKMELEVVEWRTYLDKWSPVDTVTVGTVSNIRSGPFIIDEDFESLDIEVDDIVYVASNIEFQYTAPPQPGAPIALLFSDDNQGISWDFIHLGNQIRPHNIMEPDPMDLVTWPGWTHGPGVEIMVYTDITIPDDLAYQGTTVTENTKIYAVIWYKHEAESKLLSLYVDNMYFREHLVGISFQNNNMNHTCRYELTFDEAIRRATMETQIRSDNHKFKLYSSPYINEKSILFELDLYNHGLFFTTEQDSIDFVKSIPYPVSLASYMFSDTFTMANIVDATHRIIRIFSVISDIYFEFKEPLTSAGVGLVAIRIPYQFPLDNIYGINFIPKDLGMIDRRFSIDFTLIHSAPQTVDKDVMETRVNIPLFNCRDLGYSYLFSYINESININTIGNYDVQVIYQ